MQAAIQQLRKCLWKSFGFESFTLAAAGGAVSATSAASFRILSLWKSFELKGLVALASKLDEMHISIIYWPGQHPKYRAAG